MIIATGATLETDTRRLRDEFDSVTPLATDEALCHTVEWEWVELEWVQREAADAPLSRDDAEDTVLWNQS